MDAKIVQYAHDKGLIIEKESLNLLNLNNYQKILNKLSDDNNIFASREDIKKLLSVTPKQENQNKNFKILDAYDVTGKTLSQGGVEDFLNLFLDKYQALFNILKKREGFLPITIEEAKKESKNKKVDIVGMVVEKKTTKKGNLLLTVDDPTGKINIVVTENQYDVNPKEILLDNVLGFKCAVLSKDILIANEIMFADVSYDKQCALTSKDCYTIILGDTHVGSKLFREEEFNDFINWINGIDISEKDKEIIENTKYLIIAGDLVDGIGIYPKQYDELAITDLFEQYKTFEEFILKIPETIEVFLIPGNHDAVRISDPQPAIPETYIPNLYKKKNIHLLGSPSWLELEGLTFLLYHGMSLHGIFGKIKDLRMDKPDLAQKELLKRRDLMPQFGEKQTFIPIEKNFMVLREEPCVFVCGHIHHHSYSKYKHVHLISTSCWQSITSFQQEMGHTPTVSKAILFNLKDQKISIKDFEKKTEPHT